MLHAPVCDNTCSARLTMSLYVWKLNDSIVSAGCDSRADQCEKRGGIGRRVSGSGLRLDLDIAQPAQPKQSPRLEGGKDEL